MATDIRKHDAPAPLENPRREAINRLSESINDPIPVANTTERAQLVADMIAKGMAPSSARPLWVVRQDALTGREYEYTKDPTGAPASWRTLGGTPTTYEFDGGSMAGAAYTGQAVVHRTIRRSAAPDANGDFILLPATAYAGGGVLDADFRSFGTLDLITSVRVLSGNIVGRAYNSAGTLVTSSYLIVGHALYFTGA